MSVVSRVADTDRFPFLKALAHIAAVDDSVTLDEKQMVMTYAEAWSLGDEERGKVRDILRSGTNLSLQELVSEFSESGTRLLLVQELVRLSFADGTYGEAEKSEVAEIARHMELSQEQLRDLELWVERGEAWRNRDDDEAPGTEELEALLKQDDGSDEHDLSDIDTGDIDLSDLDPEESK